MDVYYDVYLDQNAVGTVIVRKEGLYYHLDCLCPIPMREPYYLVLNTNIKEINLGVCVPYANGFGLKTRLKVSTTEESAFRFVLHRKRVQYAPNFYPVFEDKPFTQIESLEGGYLTIQEGQVGITFDLQSSIESSSPTGQ